MTNSMTRYETVFESTKNLPRFIEIGHGENADLYTSITDCGVPVSLSGYTVSALYQPSSKWETTEYYSCPLEVVGDTVIIHWSHLQDNGDNGVKMWVSFSKDDELAYPALYKIGLFKTPGFEPSPITPIPEVLDFSLYTLLNAPWVLPEELSAYATTASLSAYATTESLSDYATTASLSAYATQSEVDEFHEDFRQAITDISNTKYMKEIKSGEVNNIYLYSGYSIYRATLSSNTTGYRLARPQSAGIPTDDFYYDYEIEVSVPANATSLSGPTSDWTWMEGGELPTDPSDFAGKTIYIACRFDCDARTTLANVWRIA